MWLVYPTILPELVKRGTDDLGSATIRLVPAFYTLFLPTQILLGAGQEGKNGRAGGEGLGTAGKFGSSLERGLWGLCWGGQERHTSDKDMIPHARSGLSKYVPLMALRGASSA